ncbi:unnamed protein product [Effrenium voratum]|uniref:Copper transport protein n=1 Tax=Effrenium voratum TaxID=2562239 RepID=A0AA36NHA4_9DINO|nr:unnamed protein product [Effrenium voratum]
MAHDHGQHGHDMGDMDMDMEVFCLGNGTVMLNGFQVAIGPGQPCAMALFPGWVLDSGAKYVATCVGAFMLPLAIVGFQMLRERLLRPKTPRPVVDLAAALVFGGQMLFAYCAMLLAMLYEIVIFICILLGFVVSALCLQRHKRAVQQVPEVASTPCCSLPPPT